MALVDEINKIIKIKRCFYNYYGVSLYTLDKYPNRVLKIAKYSDNINKLLRLLAKIKRDKNPAIVKVHEYGKFSHKNKKYYYYIMDKLRPLPMTHSHGASFVDYLEAHNLLYSKRQLPFYMSDKIKAFIFSARKFKKKHMDVHAYNIMIDRNNNLKFIDIESFFLG